MKKLMLTAVVFAAMAGVGFGATSGEIEYAVLSENIPLRFSYIESLCTSAGSQYINTLYNPKASDKVELSVSISSSQPIWCENPYPTIFGEARNNNSTRYLLQANSRSKSAAVYRRASEEIAFSPNIPRDKWVDIVCEDRLATWSNRTERTCGECRLNSIDGDASIPFAIFQCNRSTETGGMEISTNWYCNMKLHSFRIASSGGTIMRDFVPYRTADGQVGLWDDAATDGQDAGRFYPNVGVGSFQFGGVAYQVEGEAMKVFEGTLLPGDTEGWATVEKVGANYAVSAAGITSYPTLKISAGTFSMLDGKAHDYTCESLVLAGGTVLEMDLLDTAADRFVVGSLDLSGASAANPITLRFGVLPPKIGDYVLIDKGCSSGDLEKFSVSGTNRATLSVADGALVVSLSVETLYVDAQAPSDREPPYDTPDRAARRITTALGSVSAGGCRVVLQAGQTFNMGDEEPERWTNSFELVGSGDQTSVIQSTNSRRPVLSTGQVLKNVVLRGSVDAEQGWENGVVGLEDGGQLVDCIVENFTQRGIVAKGGKMTDCIIRNSHQSPKSADTAYGALMLVNNASFTCVRCVFSNVVARSRDGAGAIAAVYTSGTPRPKIVLDRCVFDNCRGRLGVMRMGQQRVGFAYVTNCLFTACRNINYGSVQANNLIGARGEFVNCTFTGNRSDRKGEMYLVGSNPNNEEVGQNTNLATIKFVNVVVSGNLDVDGEPFFKGSFQQSVSGKSYGPITASHSLFPEVEAGSGDYSADNITGPAVFSAKRGTSYLLQRGTPGSNAGDASIWTKDDTDLAGRQRISSRNLVDMGCYQWFSDGLAILIF